MTINCDLGEEFNANARQIDAEIMPYLDLCNIACGSHSGNLDIMSKTLICAKDNHVKVGAHPSYPDRANFGRVSIVMKDEDFKKKHQRANFRSL